MLFAARSRSDIMYFATCVYDCTCSFLVCYIWYGCVCKHVKQNKLFLLDLCHMGNFGSLDLCNEHCINHNIDAGSLQCVCVSTPNVKLCL